jgi:hypothetical protein
MKIRDILGEDVWHGSPHRHQQFKLDNVGTGEGNIAYGWGLYFAGAREVAEYYRNGLSPGEWVIHGKRVRPKNNAEGWLLNHMTTMMRDKGHAGDVVEEVSQEIDTVSFLAPKQKQVAKTALAAWIEAGIEWKSHGHVYHAQIPDEGSYLLWDEPYKNQPRAVKSALRKLTDKYKPHMSQVIKDNDTGEVIYRHMGNYNRNVARIFDEQQINRKSSMDLASVGIAGIKYLDGMSRYAGTGTYNYVVFDENAVQIKNVE